MELWCFCIVFAPLIGVLISRGVWQRAPLLMSRGAFWGTVVSFLGSSTLLIVAANTPHIHSSPTVPQPIREAFHLSADTLPMLMLVLVSFIGMLVISYSQRYLDGDTRKPEFLCAIATTISLVQLQILSSSLLMFVLVWMAVSLSLHRLLLFYPDRRNAVLCARKKFIVSRLGDLFLFAAVMLLLRKVGTTDFAALFQIFASNSSHPQQSFLNPICLLIALGVVVKSAQFPFHSWLPESLETPTPVSALMHAGIVNSGGFLLIRLSALFQSSPGPTAVLVLIGACTALYGMSVMVTQTSIKKRLAYSTVGQMGFMILECGLGFYHLAMLHILAHSLYKAHAFLSAGSAMEQARDANFYPRRRNISVRDVTVAVAVICLLFAVGSITLYQQNAEPKYFPILLVWSLSVFHLLWTSHSLEGGRKASFSYALLFVTSGGLLTWSLSGLMLWLVGDSFVDQVQLGWPVALVVGLLFSAGSLLQVSIQLLSDVDVARRWFLHLHNGFYVSDRARKCVDLLWPIREQKTQMMGTMGGTR